MERRGWYLIVFGVLLLAGFALLKSRPTDPPGVHGPSPAPETTRHHHPRPQPAAGPVAEPHTVSLQPDGGAPRPTVYDRGAPPTETPSFDPRTRLLAGARVTASAERGPDSGGRVERVRLVKVAYKYPLVRVVSSRQADPRTGKEVVAPDKLMVADHILVRLREGATEEDLRELNRRTGAVIRKALHTPGLYLVAFDNPDLDLVPRQVEAYLAEAAVVAYAEPDYIVFATARFPNDPRFSDLYGMHNTGQTGGTPDADIDAPEAWDIATGDETVVVGVIDTGVDYHHEDLAANVWVNPGEIPDNLVDDDGNGFVDDVHGWDFANDDSDPFDDGDHGSHVSGTIAAVGDNGVGVVGVCWRARIMGLKFLTGVGIGSTSDAVDALNYAVMMRRQGVNIRLTNNSWGGGGFTQSLLDAIVAGANEDMLFVAAAGNDGTDNDRTPHYPSNYDHESIISVANTTHDDVLSSLSNYGAVSVDLAAPGSSILSTIPGNNYLRFSGTSMASPHVAGVAALVWSVAPDATYQEVRDILFAGVDPVPALDGQVATGGRLDARRTLEQLGMLVRSSTPAGGDILAVPPTRFEIEFSDAFEPGSLQASDFSLDGVPAGRVITESSTTVSFFTAAVGTEGLHTMSMAEGAVTRISDGDGVGAWNATFRYDTVRLGVTSTVPPDGADTLLPLVSVRVDFNEAVDPASVDPGDLGLSQGRVLAAATVDVDSVVFTLDEVVAEGVLDLVIPAGALTDLNGNPNRAFTGHLNLDFGTVPVSDRFARVRPAGSLVYGLEVEGRILPDLDRDRFTMDLDPGQRVTVVLEPDENLQASLTLLGPSNAVIATSTAGAAGEATLLQAAAVNLPGAYALEVTGTGGTTGGYVAVAHLNAGRELEQFSGSTNDSAAAAEDLDALFLPVATSEKASVFGHAGVPGGVPAIHAETEPNDDGTAGGSAADLGFANDWSGSFVPSGAHRYSAALRGEIDAGNDEDWDFFMFYASPGDTIEIDLRGATSGAGTLPDPYLRLYDMEGREIASNDDFSGLESHIEYAAFARAGSYYAVADSFGSSAGTYLLAATQATTRPLNGVTASEDWYAFTLASNEVAGLLVSDAGGEAPTLELYHGPDRVAVAIDLPGVGRMIPGFPAPDAGTYHLKVAGAGPYHLLATRQAVFADGRNTTAARARDLSLSGRALGRLGAAGHGRLFALPTDGTPFIVELDPATGDELRRISAPEAPSGGPDALAYSGSSLFFYNSWGSQTLWELDPESGTVLDSDPMPTAHAASDGMTMLEGLLYILDYGQSDIAVFDPETDTIVSVLDVDALNPGTSLVGGLGAITDPDALVATDNAGTRIVEIDPGSGLITSEFTPAAPGVSNYISLAVIDQDLYAGTYTLDILDVFNRAGTLLRSLSLPYSLSGLAASSTGGNEAWYTIEVNRGDRLNLSTTTPGDGPLQFVNTLDPAASLYGPDGSLLAADDNGAPDGRNALLAHVAETGGTYRVSIVSTNETAGEYLVAMTGATGHPLSFSVLESSPDDGALLGAAPSRVVLHFSSPVAPDSLEAADLRIDGTIPAPSATLVDGDTIAFDLPPLDHGTHTFTIRSGTLLDLAGAPVDMFVSTVDIDLVPPRVVDSSVQRDAVLSVGPLTYTAVFSEPLNTNVLDAADVRLEGDLTGLAVASDFTYEPSNRTLTVMFPFLADDLYVLTLQSGNGGFEDPVGHALDGETPAWPIPPNRSGDDQAGGHFVVPFSVDTSTMAWPGAFRVRPPRGALVHESTASVQIAPAGDADRFTLALDAGQVLTAVAEPDGAVRPRLEVYAPGSRQRGAAVTAGAGGEAAVLRVVEVPVSGVYTVVVSGADAAVGPVRLDLILNAAREFEPPLGTDNDLPANAENLDPGAVGLGGGVVVRTAAAGSPATTGSVPSIDAEVEPNDDGVPGGSAGDLLHANDWSGSFSNDGGDTYAAALRGLISSGSDEDWDFFRVLASPGDHIEITLKGAGSGVGTLNDTYLRLYNDQGEEIAADDDGGEGVESLIVFDDFTYRGSYYVVADSFGDGTGTYRLDARHTTPEALKATVDGEDWYRFTLAGDEEISLVLGSSQPGPLGLELYGAGGATLLTAAGPSANALGLVNGFVAPEAGTYYARVTGRTDYTLALVRGAWFEEEPNNDPARALLLPGEANILGYLGAGGLGRLYAFDATARLIKELDPETGDLLNAFASPAVVAVGPDFGMATSPEALLVGGSADSPVFLLHPDTGAILRTLPNPGIEISGMAYLAGEVFLLTDSPGDITVIDYYDGSVLRTLDIKLPISECLGAHPGGLLSLLANLLISIDPRTGATSQLGTLEGSGEGLGVIDDEIYVAGFNSIGAFDLDTLQLNRILGGFENLEALGADGGGPEADVVRIDVVAGDHLTLATVTPGDGPFLPENAMDPALELYDPAGTLVASDDDGAGDGRNAEIVHTAATSGVYVVHTASDGKMPGEYLLQVSGATGPGPGFRVITSDPADGAGMRAPPAGVVLTFNAGLLLPSLDAADLLVNGVPATGITMVNARTIAFDLPALDTDHYDLTLAGGAVTSVAGRAVAPFQSSFSLQGPRVVAGSIQEHDALATDPLTATFTFDRKMKESNIDAGDIRLEGEVQGAVQLSSAQYLAGSPTSSVLEIALDSIADDNYTLTLRSGDGRFEDEAGRDLDGEATLFPVPPHVSGDGAAGGDFVLHFSADSTEWPLPASAFTPRQPPGSLVYEATVRGVIQDGVDEDRFTMNVSSGQTLTVIIREDVTLIPVVELAGDGTSGTPPTRAVNGVIQTFPVVESAVVTLSISGAGNAGPYEARILLNAAIEMEFQGGPSNDSSAGAQDLSGSSIPVGGGKASRCAVVGRLPPGRTEVMHHEDFERGVLGSAWSTYRSLPGGRTRVGDDQGAAAGSFALLMDRAPSGPETLNEAVWTVDLDGVSGAVLHLQHAEWYDEDHPFAGDFSGHFNADGVAVSDDGVNWHPVLNAPGQPARRWRPHAIDLGAEASAAGMTLGPDFHIKFQQYDDGKLRLDGRGWDELEIIVPRADEDWYVVNLEAGQRASFVLASPTGGTARLELFDEDGTTLLATTVPAEPGVQVVEGFAAPAEGDYLVRVSGRAETYDLLVTKDSDFDIEPNTWPARVRDVTSAGRVMGHVGLGENDNFTFEARSGARLGVVAATPFKGPPGTMHGLMPTLALIDPSGSTQRVANASSSGLAGIDENATEDGAYTVSVGASAGAGEYELSVAGGTGLAVADLLVWHEQEPGRSVEGCLPHFVVAVSNHGPSVATEVLVAYEVDPGMRVVSAAPMQGTAQRTMPVLWHAGTLAVGQTAYLDVGVTMESPGVLSNEARVVARAFDPQPTNNLSVSTTSVSEADLLPQHGTMVRGTPVLLEPPPFPDQNRAGESLDLDLSGGDLRSVNTCTYGGRVGHVYFNYDETHFYVGGHGLDTLDEANRIVLYLGLNTLPDDLHNSAGKTGAPAELNLLDNLHLESAMDIAILLGDEFGDGTDPSAGHGVYRLGGSDFQPVTGSALAQFDGSGYPLTLPTSTSDDDGDRATDRWEASIPWSSLNAPSGIVSVTSLRVAGVLVGPSRESRRFIYRSYLGASAEGKTGLEGDYGYEDVFLKGLSVGLPDRDGDGLPDWWETRFGLDADDDGTVDPDNGPDGDPDEDHATNAEERAAGTDPKSAASVFRIDEISVNPSRASVNVLTQPGQRYAIEYRDGGLAGPGAWKPFANDRLGVGAHVEGSASPTNFTFVDDYTPATSGVGPTGTPSRAYRVQTEEP